LGLQVVQLGTLEEMQSGLDREDDRIAR